MNKAITITSNKRFNAYTVAPSECKAILSRCQRNHAANKYYEWLRTPVSYRVIGYVNGVFTNVELHNYHDAKRLFLAMCKA